MEFGSEIIRAVAGTLDGGCPISEPAAASLAAHVELRMRQIVQDAVKLAHHAKRARITTEDINHALRLHSLEPLYGFSSNEPVRFVQQTQAAVDAAKRKAESAMAKIQRANVRRMSESAKAAATKRKAAAIDACDALRQVDPKCYFFFEPEVDLSQISLENLPAPPVQPRLVSHWMVVNGVQPSVPQNVDACALDRVALVDDAAAAAARLGDEEHIAAMAKGIAVTNSSAAAAGGGGGGGGDLGVQPLLSHTLSQELMLYFNNVTTVLADSSASPDSAARRSSVFRSLRRDPGLQQLVPYLSRWVIAQVTLALRQRPRPPWLLAGLYSLMRAVNCMLSNSHIRLELYLHQLMPAVLSCVLNKRLSAVPTQDHWRLRDYAAGIVRDVCATYGSDYPRLQPRISKTLHNALTAAKKPLSTRYGALVGIAALGPLATEQLMLPHFSQLTRSFEALIAGKNLLKAHEATHCYTAASRAVGGYLRHRLVNSGVGVAAPSAAGLSPEKAAAAVKLSVEHENGGSGGDRTRTYHAWATAPSAEKGVGAAGGKWVERSREGAKPGDGASAAAQTSAKASPKVKGKSKGKGRGKKGRGKDKGKGKVAQEEENDEEEKGGKTGGKKMTERERAAARRERAKAALRAAKASDATDDLGLPARLAEMLPESGVENPEVFFPYTQVGPQTSAGNIGGVFI